MAVLTRKQLKAIAALLSAPNIKLAAQAAGIGERTLYRWLNESEFKSELRRVEMQAIDQATRRLIGSQEPAVNRLLIILDSTTAKNADRLRAACALLEFSARLLEVRDLEERITRLEDASDVEQQS